MKILALWLSLLLVLLGLPAWAADCDAVTGYVRQHAEARILCDSKTGVTTCGACDTGGGHRPYRTMFCSIDISAGCASLTVQLQTRSTATGIWHPLGAALTLAAASQRFEQPVGRYIRADITAATTCTEIEVLCEKMFEAP